MRLDVPPPAARRLSLTSLIDVIFLLLLFFMLSSTFSRFGSVELSTPGGGNAAVRKPDVILSVKADRVLVNGETAAPTDLGSILKELRAGGSESLLVLVDDQATSQSFVAAMEQARASGLAVSVGR
ncbi:MAG: biopolymer transporter ExbD [Pseudomonadota bacterium]